MISMDFVRKMEHSHNQAVYAIRKHYQAGIGFDSLLEQATEFVDDEMDEGVFKAELRKMYNARERAAR